ncbi:putative ribosomal protein S16 [Lyophyllum shimeji]|uniref:Ribosomal protein S16 n=1 Tax=Lyophyllum shimeji TaxID=47721 RepID=A0A9P3UJX4_LYOSH|nr:putative ribosomal protein S16 [Lyophyllum shimeji]
MPVRLRFSLHGTRHSRIFHLVAVEQGARRDAKPTELLGIFNRYPSSGQKTIEWSVDRIRYWLKVGAVPTKSVAKLLELGNILKPNSPYHSNATRAPLPPAASDTLGAPETEARQAPIPASAQDRGVADTSPARAAQ